VGPTCRRRCKKKREGGERWAGGEDWAGPFGPKGWLGLFVCFFPFLFQTSFSNPISTQIQIKLLQISLKNFIDFLETTQATKTMQAN
jgi:hypothetical protein